MNHCFTAPTRMAFLATAVLFASPVGVRADDAAAPKDKETASSTGDTDANRSATATATPAKTGSSSAPSAAKKPKPPAYAALLKDAKKISGMIPLYQKESHLYAELSGSQYNKDLIVLISIARGIGQGVITPGMTWKGEDDWVWQFRKVDKRVLVVRRNVRFRAKSGSPQASAVANAYSDSVLFSLPIITKGPSGGDLVDLSLVFMTDLPQISHVLKGFMFSKSRSLWSSVKGFKDNIEVQVAATYASSGTKDFISVPDSRCLTINVHYSISKIPNTGYKPRVADERIGYFITALMDFSKKTYHDRFVRYINRWDLRKAEPSAKRSPPKTPIVFWIENTVPFKFRRPIREGILEWNKAFEKAGFIDAIEVRQQPANCEWDPEDIHYNTIRWITSGRGFAYGPSRVNPRTGQILDADILVDADFLQYPQELLATFSEKGQSAGSHATLLHGTLGQTSALHRHGPQCGCQFHQGLARELAMGSILLGRQASPEEVDKLIMQGLRSAVMHEVGHTLGLRHNFKASTNRSIKQLNDPNYIRKHGSIASVMDYLPANLVTKGTKQGDYYPATIGVYDDWAIEYGYKPISGGSAAADLKKIASRCGEPGLAYSSDEDTRGADPDPLSARFDLGKNPIEFAHYRAKLVAEQIPGLVDRITKEGDNYYQVRRSFGILLATHGMAMHDAARMIGGVYVHRHRKGDKDAPPPFVVVPADQQREALKLLEEQVFSDKPFEFPPELYNHLSSPRWIHWGTNLTDRVDYPVHRVIAMWQGIVMDHLLSPLTLTRIHDSELKVAAKTKVFTAAELLQRLTRIIFSEVENPKAAQYTNRKPAISSLRRNLQRKYLQRFSNLALGNTAAPYDCQTIARVELAALKTRMLNVLGNNQVKLDDYTRAHLEEATARITKVLDAQLELSRP